MEVDDEDMEEEVVPKGAGGKRVKWQSPPSHHHLLPSGSPSSSTTPMIDPVGQNSSSNGKSWFGSRDDGRRNQQTSSSSSTTHTETFRDIANEMRLPRFHKLSMVARAEICPKIRRARLMGTKGIAAKIREQYGYEISNTTFLFAEEALYLLETGRLELYLGKVSLSMERARALLLHSKSEPSVSCPEQRAVKIKTCSVDEYLVYKHLSELGYRLHRKELAMKPGISTLSSVDEGLVDMCVADDLTPSEPKDQAMTMEGNGVGGMDLDGDEELQLTDRTAQPLSSSSSGIGRSGGDEECHVGGSTSFTIRGVKRKFEELSDHTHGSTTPSNKDMSDDEDADEELDLAGSGSVPEHSHFHGLNATDATMDSTEGSYFHPTAATASGYTVTEADSDVELTEVDDSSPLYGVHIEEVGHGYDGDVEDSRFEPQPSTSAACFTNQGQPESFVDLADSSDSDESDNLSWSKRIWNKFIPNSTIQIGFPPRCLLPPNVPFKDKIYEHDLRARESIRTAEDLEYFVDELCLANSGDNNNSLGEKRKKGFRYKSWKDWRQDAVGEAQEVRNTSLLGISSNGHGKGGIDVMEKLHLWGHKEPGSKRKEYEGWSGFDIPFELYHPTTGSVKTANKKDVTPIYVVAVVRNDDVVPSFAGCDSHINGISVLIALVSDESSILFMNPNRSPIPSLF